MGWLHGDLQRPGSLSSTAIDIWDPQERSHNRSTTHRETNAAVSLPQTLGSVWLRLKGKLCFCKAQPHSFQSASNQLEAIFKNFLALLLDKKRSAWKPNLRLTLIGSRWIPELLAISAAELKPT